VSTLADAADKAPPLCRGGPSANTHRAYGADLRAFEAWCAGRGLVALPAEPQTIALYFADQAGELRTATLSRRLAARRHAPAARAL
jgi:site-specific recombinase XerD